MPRRGLLAVATPNRLFTSPMLRVLLRPDAWRLVTSRVPDEVEPMTSPGHADWMRANSHSHPLPEILVILSGCGCHGYQGQVYPTAPGTVFVFDAFEDHDLACPPWAPDADHLWIALTADAVVARLLAIRAGETRWSGEWSRVLRPSELGLVSVAALLGTSSQDRTPELARLRLVSGLGLVCGALVGYGCAEAEEREGDAFRREIVRAVQRHLEETGGRDADLDSLSRLAGYSKFHFLRLFRLHAGMTVHQYVDLCRLRRVEEMRGAGRTYAEISAALGFSCPAAFSRWFRTRRPGSRE